MTDSTKRAELTTGQPSVQVTRPDVEEGGTQLRILLAEDSPTNQLIATINLEQAGHAVEVVDNGRKAVQALREGNFDLVLMDVFMPEMDGLEATRIIRQREAGAGQHIPIIAMTATDTQEHREECLKVGMDGFVSKPVIPNELHSAIALLLPRDRTSLVQEPQVAEKSQSTLSVDLDEALKAVDGDIDLLRDVVEMFSEEYPAQADALQEALARRDAEGVENAAHRLKRVLGNVGGLTARDLARRLEAMGETGKLDGGLAILEALEAEVERVAAFFSEPGWEQGALKG